MKIIPYGAAGGEVTGSAYLVQTQKATLLVDFGLFQGTPQAEEKNRDCEVAGLGALDAVLVTHGHLDHTGRLPLLVQHEYPGPVLATPATLEIAGLILRDAAKIQASDAERTNRRRKREGQPPVEPLYTPQAVEALIAQFRAAPYHQPTPVAPGVQARFVEAGHILGSASIQLQVEEKGRQKTVVFSGDLGPQGAPILKDYETFSRADVVFLESTYGDHDHRPFLDTVEEFVGIVQEAVKRRGKILVPTFAVGRAQTLMGLLAWMFRRRKVEPFPIYLDSPMAVEATAIYEKHPELYDEEALAFIQEGPFRQDLLRAHSKLAVTAEESRALNDVPGPCMILAGAGMCNAGRILHHLRHNLFKAETHVLIVGYQGSGTLGRQLVDGADGVSIFGEKVAVRATIHTLGGFSAHAGQKDLLKWFGAMAASRPRVILTHGEEKARTALAAKIREQFDLPTELPGYGQTIEI